jgi:putative ABC transport system substrate-binding protein
MPVVGFLSTGTLESSGDAVAEFRSGLADAGYFEGKNIAIQWGWGNNQQGHLQTVAVELVDLRVVMIVAYGPLTVAHAAKTATSTIPIVIAGGVDPVRFGLVASLNRPGGNITGVTAIHSDLTGKRLDLLCKLVPQATTIGYLTSACQ